ncbi:MAG TPA: penicillin-binding transpeptidase domain-containing protein [Gemmatimonadaceae bacterium]|nr:penicillin-binding transpeptidase domain-containing protein [Gemmatimonadaceae bacterium]
MNGPSRVGIVHLGLACFAVAIVGKAANVQLRQGRVWAASALRQQSTERIIPAPRGEILDAAGATLAQSRETVKLDVAPHEVRNRRALRDALASAAVPAAMIARATDPGRRWVSLPGRYGVAEVARLSAMRGVYTTPVVERAYASADGLRRIIGRVDADGRAMDGVELALDPILRGTSGSATVMRDARGRKFESPAAPGITPVMGHTVVLTINHELQEIAERALADAVEKMGAEGGDVVVLDPADGGILAMASQRQDPRATAATALTEPYEPGSTIKPFIAAMLLEKGRARETDVVNTFNGTLTINGRTINDEHRAARLSLAEVIRWSSNVGIVQFAERLSPREEYETLRDFGFGTATGVPYPVEASGTLREPARWSSQSGNSMAMGYEIAVTPLQLAAAYVALANDGELLEPALVKEVRAPDGRVLFRHERRVVRRVVSPAVARRVRTMLLSVVEGGTAVKADLGSFSLAGKTGTSRRTVEGRYAAGQHIPTFVGLFPADHPQFVILVKLDNPRGAYVGGLTAAPVTKAVLEAALASRNAALDRGTLAASRRERPLDADGTARRSAAAAQVLRDSTADARAVEDDSGGSTPFVALLPAPAPSRAVPLPARAVPDVRGLSARRAVLALHAAGFRVQLVAGVPGVTTPAVGSMAAAGTVVRLTTPP